ncbi:hypothetical protein [Crateriforma conspicua]|uniref:Uncharacterized protein n=1 Tax=Crateriforma conspicua TaxID=2527996 RepID=A0A5C5Y973_9PLAN|nr:hypothetical protein [Crateriforma conspicua]TWT71469.1 hypothetical protein Pan14r_37790 [Crateriforma conspicua]
MIRLFQWLFTPQPRFRPCDGCDPSDLAIVRKLADALEAREAADAELAKQRELAC